MGRKHDRFEEIVGTLETDSCGLNEGTKRKATV